MKIKANDVFKAKYTDDFRNKSRSFDLRHCFEGTLIACDVKGDIILYDTYWGIGDRSGKRFFLSDIDKVINIELMGNLDDYEEKRDAQKYYDDSDIIVLTRQHGCSDSCVYTFLKKGAEKSKTKMRSVILSEIGDAEFSMRFAKFRIESLNKDLDLVENGDLDSVYL